MRSRMHGMYLWHSAQCTLQVWAHSALHTRSIWSQCTVRKHGMHAPLVVLVLYRSDRLSTLEVTYAQRVCLAGEGGGLVEHSADEQDEHTVVSVAHRHGVGVRRVAEFVPLRGGRERTARHRLGIG